MTPQEIHQKALANGCSPQLAEMLALGRPPGCNTDREFLRGHANGSQFSGRPELGDAYASVARAGGVDPKGKVYLSGLAAFPGDPRAWVSGRGEVKSLCEERGWNCDGLVKVKSPREVPDPGPYKVADDLVAARATELMDRTGGEMRPGDADERAREQLSPDWK